jgi:hypothetical protein
LLPAGAVAGRALHPLESAAFSRRTPPSDSCSVKTDALPSARDADAALIQPPLLDLGRAMVNWAARATVAAKYQ